MDLNFFKQTRILDGGMGQELLARGLEIKGTLWSANALLQNKYHDLLLNTHLDFIRAGAEVIVTTTFTTRRKRLKENMVELSCQLIEFPWQAREPCYVLAKLCYTFLAHFALLPD